MSHAPQIFKNRKEALNWLHGEDVPVSQGKFYQDCDKYKMLQPDKSVLLCDVVAYMKREFNFNATGPAIDLGAEEHQRQLRNLEMRKLVAEVEAKEKASRKEDDRYIEVVEHQQQMAAFAGLLEDTLRQFTTMRLNQLIYIVGGDLAKAAELNQALEDLYADTFTDAVREHTREIAFEDDDEYPHLDS